MWETWVQSLSWEDPLEKGMATHSRTLAWRIPWTGTWQPRGCKKSDVTEQLTLSLTHTHTHRGCIVQRKSLHNSFQRWPMPVILSVISTSSIRITWELAGNIHSQANPRPSASETWGQGPAIWVIISCPVSLMNTSV